ncbi:contractile injection system tape measure protein [Enterobacter ludwigii]
MVNIGRIRFRLKLDYLNADSYSDRTSRLFHRELKMLMARVFARLIPEGVSFRLESPLVLTLGDISGSFFEYALCSQLENALEMAIRQLMAERPVCWTRDSQAQCRELLTHALHSGEESADNWLVRQLVLGPDIWRPLLAEYALLPEGGSLYYMLQEATVHDLCQKLAPDIQLPGRVTENSLWLCALHFFLQHPELSAPPLQINSVSGVSHKLRAWATTAQTKRYDLQLIKALFEPPLSCSASLIPWLKALWQNPAVVEGIRPVLDVKQIMQWHQVLTGKSQSQGPFLVSQSLRSDNQTSSPVSEESSQLVSCAGLVLLWPMLPGLFRYLGVVEGRQFVNQEAQRRASGYLLWMVHRQNQLPAEQTVGRLLCGLASEVEITDDDMPDSISQQMLAQWLKEIPALLPATLKKLSAEDIRQWFLLRPGWITLSESTEILHVQSELYDILLKDWPWPMNLVALPWLEQPLTVRWYEK